MRRAWLGLFLLGTSCTTLPHITFQVIVVKEMIATHIGDTEAGSEGRTQPEK